MKIVSVIPFKKGLIKDNLTYFTNLEVSILDIVSVPIKSKESLALVTSIEELKDKKSNIKSMDFNLKKIIKNKGGSIFLKEYLDSVLSCANYFAQNKNNTIASLIPNIFIEKYDEISKLENLGTLHLNSDKKIRSEKFLFQCSLEERISTYKTLIRESFARGRSVFMVLPTEFDIEKFNILLKKGIEQFTFTMHSGISAKKNLVTYKNIISSTHPVFILATAPFLCIPKKDIDTIILEHENSNAYKMQRKPNFDFRTFTEVYAAKVNAKLIMADEVLRFETIGRKDMDNLNPIRPLSFRVDFMDKIEILKVKNSQEKKDEIQKEDEENNLKFRIFSPNTIQEIKNNIQNKKSVLVFSLRKGLATMTVCRDCGETMSCEKCGSPIVIYLSHQNQKRTFACNRCEEQKGEEYTCPACKSWNLMPLGIGTDTVYEELDSNLNTLGKEVKIFKLDKDSAKTASGAQKIIKEFEENEGSILVATEMAFFYLKNKVPFSIIASFDSLWSIPNFKMNEKVIQIILSMILNTTEKLLIQTKNEKDKAILAIKNGNLWPFIREELEDRKKLDYPPFKTFIKIIHLNDKKNTAEVRKMLTEMFKDYSMEIFSGFVPKFKDKYITNALIKIDPTKWSLNEISLNGSIDKVLLEKLLSLPPSFNILVDPEDLL